MKNKHNFHKIPNGHGTSWATTGELLKGFFLIFILFVFAFSCQSCKAYTRMMGAGGNPDPNMKSVHMATTHPGYTLEDYHAHHDHDCSLECNAITCKIFRTNEDEKRKTVCRSTSTDMDGQ